MKKINRTNLRKSFAASMVAALGLATLSLSSVFAQTAPLTRQLDPGAMGADVKSLQEFLAQDISIYPEALVTGYYGTLTQNAVMRYQTRNGLEAVGRVGPLTLQKINQQMATGMYDISAPVITNPNVTVARNSATFTWNTAEASIGKVYYSKTPFTVNEGTGVGSTGFYVSGNTVQESSYLNNHTVVLQNLDPNSVYYYTIVSADMNGNYNMTMVTNTFTTTQ